MNIRTIRATANNLITALEIDRNQCIRVGKFEIKKFNDEEGAKATVKRHNEQCDALIRTLSMLYITAYDGKNINGMCDELEAQQMKVHNLRVDFWNDVLYSEEGIA